VANINNADPNSLGPNNDGGDVAPDEGENELDSLALELEITRETPDFLSKKKKIK